MRIYLLIFFVTRLVRGEYSSSGRECYYPVETNVGKFCGKDENIPLLKNAKVHAYLGIKYGKAPVGDLRFKKSEQFNRNRDDVIFATEYGPSCMQNLDTRFQSNKAIQMWGVTENMSEDCLFLNVWVPKTVKESNKKVAVLVWIHGGGYDSGSASLMVYDGKILAAHQNVIVVSMNYRLGAFGFAYLGDNTIEGNMGLLDQNLALKWVQNNIGEFGGDRERVTIMGQSSGAASVGAHIFSRFETFFKNAIIQSSSILNIWASINSSIAINHTNTLLDKLGCTQTGENEKLKCLRDKSSEDILKITDQESFKPARVRSFFPNEEKFSNLSQFKLKGGLLAGINKNEGSLISLYTLFNDTLFDNKTTLDDLVKNRNKNLSGDILEQTVGDTLFKCQTIEFAKFLAKKDRPVFFYTFQYRTESLPMPKWMGTYQGNELDYNFGMPYHQEFQDKFYSFTESEREIAHMIMTYWGNFVKSGNPNTCLDDANNILPMSYKEGESPDLYYWPCFDENTQLYLNVNETNGKAWQGSFPRKQTCKFVNMMLQKFPQKFDKYKKKKTLG